MGLERFSEAERDACLKVVRLYGGEVTHACWSEAKQKIDRHVSKPTLLKWYRESLADPKRLHRRVNPKFDAVHGGDSQPLLGQLGESGEVAQETDDLSGLDISEKLEYTIDHLLKLTSAERESLPPEKRLRLVPSLLE